MSPASEVMVSLIICTRNRAAHLRETLEAMRVVELPKGMAVELVVVDNGSTDDTPQIVQSACISSVTVRRVTEPRQGLDHARNRGLLASHGDVLVFVDDDVRPRRDWLARLIAPLLADEADVVAGGVVLASEVDRPWFEACHRGALASTERLEQPDGKPDKPGPMIGANMAFHRRVLERVPAFDPALDAGALGFGGETLFWHQLKRAGYRAVSRLDAVVEHHPDTSRLDRPSFLEAAWKYGLGRAYVAYHWHHMTVKRPTWHLWRARLRLAYRRLRAFGLSRPAGVPEWEMRLIDDVAFYRQYLIEQRRPHRYEQHGLVLKALDEPPSPHVHAGDRVSTPIT
jgi:glycosyltransferase involved in cell wall biosynthesis